MYNVFNNLQTICFYIAFIKSVTVKHAFMFSVCFIPPRVCLLTVGCSSNPFPW